MLCVIVLLSRLPFLQAGYGPEEDAWGLVRIAQKIYESGNYEVSRLPGHPLQEFIYLLNPYGGYLYYNLMTAVFSTAAVLFFALILRKFNVRHYLIGAAALAFTPVFFYTSTYTIDYTWSLAFILAALYFLLEKKFVLVGIFLGLATGCRITSGGMLLPFYFFAYDRSVSRNLNLQNFLRLTAPCFVISGLLYLPAFYVYGPSFFDFSDQFPLPPVLKMLYKLTIGVFGILGLAGLLFAFAVAVKNKFTFSAVSAFTKVPGKNILAGCLCSVLVTFIIYIRVPYKSTYIIPALPFLIILCAYYIPRKSFITVCALLSASSFILGMNITDHARGSTYSPLAIKFNVSGQEVFFDPLTGPVISEYSKRKLKMAYTEGVIATAQKMKNKFIVICGWWYNEIEVTLRQKNLNSYAENFVFYISKEDMSGYKDSGFDLYYLPEQALYNDIYSKTDCTRSMAQAFPVP